VLGQLVNKFLQTNVETARNDLSISWYSKNCTYLSQEIRCKSCF